MTEDNFRRVVAESPVHGPILIEEIHRLRGNVRMNEEQWSALIDEKNMWKQRAEDAQAELSELKFNSEPIEDEVVRNALGWAEGRRLDARGRTDPTPHAKTLAVAFRSVSDRLQSVDEQLDGLLGYVFAIGYAKNTEVYQRVNKIIQTVRSLTKI